jgi:hypothetical protein
LRSGGLRVQDTRLAQAPRGLPTAFSCSSLRHWGGRGSHGRYRLPGRGRFNNRVNDRYIFMRIACIRRCICVRGYCIYSNYGFDDRLGGLPDAHAHLAQHGALAFVEVKTHGWALI